MDDLLPLVGGVIGPTPDAPGIAPGASFDDIDADEGYLPWVPKIALQLNANSCVAHGASSPIEALTYSQKGARVNLSRMDLYYGARLLRGIHKIDGGCYLGDMAAWIGGRGTCSEDAWPYDPAHVTDQDPPALAEAERPMHKVPMRRLAGAADVARAILGLDGRPRRGSIFAHRVHDDFLTVTRTTGRVNGEIGQHRGNHAEWFCGWTRHAIAGQPSGVKLLGMNSWPRFGLPHPLTPGIHPFSMAWWHVDLVDDRHFVWDIFCPEAPLDVEA